VLTAARQQTTRPSGNQEGRILANKIASIIGALIVREFPQRWKTLMDDLFVPVQQGGLWYDFNNPNESATGLGVKMCLESLRLVAEDCTDSDFNTRMSTTRRNDVLIGLNEVSSRFLPLLFRLLEHVAVISQSKASLHQMRQYLLSQQQTVNSMSAEQAAAYRAESERLSETSQLVADTLSTFEKFCRSMPMDWIISPQQDVSAAFLHLMREPASDIQLLAVDCLERLCLRGKFTFDQWIRLIKELPDMISQANQQFVTEQEYALVESNVTQTANRLADPLSAQVAFHRSLSRMLAAVVNSHICFMMDKKVLQTTTPESASVSRFLRLLVDMLQHPSPRVCGEQINMWVCLLRDPQIIRGKLLLSFIQEILSAYLSMMVRLRWEDIDEQTHPQASLMEASWDDGDDYDAWINDMRSRSSQLFRFLGNAAPHMVCSLMNTRIQSLIAAHGDGIPKDHLDPSNQQLTPNSEAVRQFEGIVQPLENTLHGIPSWVFDSSKQLNTNDKLNNQAEIRAVALKSMNELAHALLQWNPNYLWLKFRRIQLLEALKHFWKYDPSTLLQGVQVLMDYLRAPDDWGTQQIEADGSRRMSGQIVSLRKKSSSALVSIAKRVPHHLVPWLSQLSEATRSLLSVSSSDLIPTNRMHLYEFLSCVATAVEDPVQRSTFVGNVLSDAIGTLELPEMQQAISSVSSFMEFLGIAGASQSPSSVTDATTVKAVTARFQRFFSAINQLLSVGKRCYEAAQKRPNGGIPIHAFPTSSDPAIQSFPDEGPISLQSLSVDDPFIPLWPRILPNVLKVVDTVFRLSRPEIQSALLKDRIQRYALAISDDEAYLSTKNDSKSGGVFGEGGTAGSVIPGVDRRDLNLAPRWSGWLQELRNSSFQLLGLVASQRALFAPEMSDMFPQFVAVVTDNEFLLSMEHRHFTQYMKQFLEVLLVSCPLTMYASHAAPILRPVFQHIQYRFPKAWSPVLDASAPPELGKPLITADAEKAAALAARGGDEWYASYYARSGIFVGDVDAVTAEAATVKHRVEMCRIYSDVIQSTLALKGDWALVLANLAKEENANKQKVAQGPKTQITPDGLVNADGTPKRSNQAAVDARKLARIAALCHFLFLEDEQVAGPLCLTIIDCLSYPDAYTCRRITRICHRLLEATAWSPRYTELLGNRLLSVAAKNLVMEPKWMVGIEWDMINVVRDIYCRLVLGQIVQPGGQGAGLQQPPAADNPNNYEQTKTAELPLQGGGILTIPSDIPRKLLASLPGIDVAMVQQLEADMKQKRSAKGQKDIIRDFLRVVSDSLQENGANGTASGGALGAFDRAVQEESLLHNSHRKSVVEDIPEKLVTQSMLNKQANDAQNNARANNVQGLVSFNL